MKGISKQNNEDEKNENITELNKEEIQLFQKISNLHPEIKKCYC